MQLLYEAFHATLKRMSQGRTALRQLLHLEALIAAHVHCESQLLPGPVTDMLLIQTGHHHMQNLKPESQSETRFAIAHC